MDGAREQLERCTERRDGRVFDGAEDVERDRREAWALLPFGGTAAVAMIMARTVASVAMMVTTCLTGDVRIRVTGGARRGVRLSGGGERYEPRG
ncbi:MAG: hypothetical protein ACJA2H_001576 [Nitriliruptoraceae bacterium]